ncbi:hypothetical protein DW974_06205 [Lachnospiraceae bacterium AM48-27BH]|nr:hypothetical protein DW974_06205 [Lachnospiraceae bacterium AM48-27BH]
MMLSLLSFIATVIFILYIKTSKKRESLHRGSASINTSPSLNIAGENNISIPDNNSSSKKYESEYQIKLKEFDKKTAEQTALLNSNIAQYKIRQKQTYDEYLKFKRYNNQYEIISKNTRIYEVKRNILIKPIMILRNSLLQKKVPIPTCLNY